MKGELIGFNMVHRILKLDEDKWTKFEFIHCYPDNFSLLLIFIGLSGVATLMPFCSISYRLPSGRLVDGVFQSVFRCVTWEWNDAPKCTKMQVI